MLITDFLWWAFKVWMLFSWGQIAVELTARCHCNAWAWTEHGARCTKPLDIPRCELVNGWHPISFGVNTCTKGACPDDDVPKWARDVPMPERPDRRAM